MRTTLAWWLVLVGGGGSLSCRAGSSAGLDAGTTDAPSWAAVEAAPRSTFLEGQARVVAAPSATAQVGVPLRATLRAIRVRPGDSVDAGAVLFDVMMPEVLEAAGRFDGAQQRLAAWAARREQLTQLQADGLARSSDVSEAVARAAEAQADLQAARGLLLAGGVREADVGALLRGTGVTVVRSPVSGVVTEVHAALGESKDATSGPLATVVGQGATRIEARFSRPPPDGVAEFVEGAKTTRVTLVSRSLAADPKDGSFMAWFETTDVHLAGTLGRVRLAVPASGAVVSVPALSVRRSAGGTEVVTTNDTVAVDVLQCGEQRCDVQGALKPGDRVRVEAAR